MAVTEGNTHESNRKSSLAFRPIHACGNMTDNINGIIFTNANEAQARNMDCVT